MAENAALRAEVEHLRSLASTDPLTGLANRRTLEARLGELFAAAGRYGWDLSCVVIDLDGLKAVNDTLGHRAGDELLRAVALTIREGSRRADVAARCGGDEFVLLLPHTAAPLAAQLAGRLHAAYLTRVLPYAERVERALSGPVRVAPRLRGKGKTVQKVVGFSAGVASRIGGGAGSGEELLAQADAALYTAKRGGPGRVEIHRGVPAVAGITGGAAAVGDGQGGAERRGQTGVGIGPERAA